MQLVEEYRAATRSDYVSWDPSRHRSIASSEPVRGYGGGGGVEREGGGGKREEGGCPFVQPVLVHYFYQELIMGSCVFHTLSLACFFFFS